MKKNSRIITGSINRIFEYPYFYKYLRGLLHFGVRLTPIKEALMLQPGDSIIDLGCGTGDYSAIVQTPKCTYLGIDANEGCIKHAKKTYANSYRRFKVLDIRKMRFGYKEFTKAIYLGMLHHLSDEENIAVLSEIKRITKERVIVMDLSPGAWLFLNKMLCKFDRGTFLRTLEEQRTLIGRVMKITSASNYYVRSGSQRYSLIACRPE